MLGFSCWNFIGASSSILRDHGGNIVINLFCGTAVNAARGIAFQMLKGVASVKVLKSTEDDDITKTIGYMEAMDDVKNGRVTHYDSVDQLFEELGIAVK